MKTISSIAALTAFLLLGFITPAGAQPFSVDWYTIAGGGGTSTGGVYAVTGTIGQPAAGLAMSGGNFTINGGFWSYIAAVQTPGSPFLSVRLTSPGAVSVYWPSGAGTVGFVLQQNADLTTTNWTAVGTSPVDDGTNVTVVISPPSGNRFYRLIHP